ncbi:24020_t:CDS:1, partial [Gigaspora margarita]
MHGARYKMSKQSSALVRYTKGLFHMLPTLENLNKWKPKTMGSENCIMCGDEETKNLNHLSSCKKLKKTWKVIENFM